jgi:hypothetical protein
MTTEREKLIEIWLDNATEREYQFAFRSALLFSGYNVIHNTSHTSLELGKDVIALAPNGEIQAYQLKGNPGGRLTISQWHLLIPQINALVYQPINHPNIDPQKIHQPFLVTNGEIHEDVAAAIVSYNQRAAASQPPSKPLKTIARGELFKIIVDHAAKLWPADLNLQRQILNILASDGEDVAPQDAYCKLIWSVLGIHDEKNKFKMERVAAAHLITSIIVQNWQKKNNLFEVVRIYILLYGAVSAYVEKAGLKEKAAAHFFQEIEFNIRETLLNFIDWVRREFDGKPLGDNILIEFSYFHLRKRMLMGLFSVAAMDTELELDDETKDFLWQFICKSKTKKFVIGEFIVPWCLAVFWAKLNLQGTNEPVRELAEILSTIVNLNGLKAVNGHIPGPYYGPEEIIKWKYGAFLGVGLSALDEDSQFRRSWFVEGLFYLIVRRNYKHFCKGIWPDLTKFLHVRTRLGSRWTFGLTDVDDSTEEDKQIRVPQSWDDVVRTIEQIPAPDLPANFLKKPIFLLLYCLFVPYRCDSEIILWLDRKLVKSWFNPGS